MNKRAKQYEYTLFIKQCLYNLAVTFTVQHDRPLVKTYMWENVPLKRNPEVNSILSSKMFCKPLSLRVKERNK